MTPLTIDNIMLVWHLAYAIVMLTLIVRTVWKGNSEQ